MYTVLRLRKTCSSCRISVLQAEESISGAASLESLPSAMVAAFFDRRLLAGVRLAAFRLFIASETLCCDPDIIHHLRAKELTPVIDQSNGDLQNASGQFHGLGQVRATKVFTFSDPYYLYL